MSIFAAIPQCAVVDTGGLIHSGDDGWNVLEKQAGSMSSADSHLSLSE